MGGTRFSPTKLGARERRPKAWALRKQGLTFEEIGRTLGVSTMTAWKDVCAEWAEYAPAKEDAEAMRREQHGRLVGYLQPLLPRVDEGDLAALDRALKIEARIAALWGLDKPVEHKVDLSVNEVRLWQVGDPFGAAVVDQQPLELPAGDAQDVVG
jgi:hypothetical protein